MSAGKIKSLYLKGCRTGYEKYWMFMTLDDVIRLLKNKRIIDFWERYSIQRLKDTEDYDYEHICDLNDLKHNYRIFAKQDINKIYTLFYELISVSLDYDPDECLNSLEAIERNKNVKK